MSIDARVGIVYMSAIIRKETGGKDLCERAKAILSVPSVILASILGIQNLHINVLIDIQRNGRSLYLFSRKEKNNIKMVFRKPKTLVCK